MKHTFTFIEDDFYADQPTKMQRTTTGGYDGERPGDRDGPDVVSFTLDRDEQGFSAQFVCILRRNGIASGLLYLGSEEEYQWLREKVNGVFRREG